MRSKLRLFDSIDSASRFGHFCLRFSSRPQARPLPQLPTFTPVPPTATPPPSVATVNGEYITAAEFQAELARYKSAQTALGITVSEEEANKVVLEDMIAQVLLAQAAREANFNLTESDLKSEDGFAG